MGKSRKSKPGPPKDKPAPPPYQPSLLRDYFDTIVICSIAALLITTFVVHPMSVPTPSMEPTILVGDRLLVDKFTVRNGLFPGLPGVPAYTPRRQDIIVCKSPLEPEIFLVKRVIGMPGDTLEIRDKTVFIDGTALDESYKQHKDPTIYPSGPSDFDRSSIPRDNLGPFTVPPDSYFVMGDNRDDSLDSRYWGFLPRKNLIGRPLILFWSFEDPPNAHLKTGPLELLQLYGERVLFFFTRTRWSRMGKLVR